MIVRGFGPSFVSELLRDMADEIDRMEQKGEIENDEKT